MRSIVLQPILGSKIRLVALGIDHLNDYERMVNNEIVHKTTEPHEDFEPYEKAKLVNWLIEVQGKEDRVDFAILKKDSEVFLGEVVLNHIKENTANIRIALLPEFFDQGFGTEAMNLAINFGFETLELKLIKLGVYDVNPRGLRVYQKLGFQETSRKLFDGISEIQMELKNSGNG